MDGEALSFAVPSHEASFDGFLPLLFHKASLLPLVTRNATGEATV